MPYPNMIDPATALILAAAFWLIYARLVRFERREIRVAREEVERAADLESQDSSTGADRG